MRGVLIVCALAGTAHADVDWAKGLVTAEGVGIADRHAPNPAVARGTSRRSAEDAARVKLGKAIGALPVATGGTVADKAKDDAVKARLDRAVAQAIAVEAQPETDGAWRVTMAVPIEAIRQAIAGGPRHVEPGGDDDAIPDKSSPTGTPIVMVVDAVRAKPAVGWTIGPRHAATLWVKELPAWAKDAGHVQATSAAKGVIEVAGTVGNATTLYVIVTP
jgi:hypothetical protein